MSNTTKSKEIDALYLTASALKDEFDTYKCRSQSGNHTKIIEDIEKKFNYLLDEENSKEKTQTKCRAAINTINRLLIEIIPDDMLDLKFYQLKRSIGEVSSLELDFISKDLKQQLDSFVGKNTNEKRAILREMQRIRVASQVQLSKLERFKTVSLKKLLYTVIVWISIIAVISVSALFILYKETEGKGNFLVYAACYVAIFGAVGGFLSASVRLDSTSQETLSRIIRSIEADLSPNMTIISFLAAPIVGSFAAFIALSFSGVALFDSFPNQNVLISELIKSLNDEKTVSKVALVTLISISAGWAERFLPDVLDSTSQKVLEKAKASKIV